MSNYKYPKDLNEKIQPYFLFSAFSWSVRKKNTQTPTSIKNAEDSITLPISTNGVNETISNNWEEAATIGSASYSKALIKNIIGKVSDSFGDLGKYLSAKKGFTINDYASLAYSGTGFRTFEFSFNLIAKNENESSMISNIIKAFKRNSLPHYDDWKIIYPNFWNIQIVMPGNVEIIKLKNCVLTDLTTSHFADNAFNVLQDGRPLNREITLSFKELDKIDRDDYPSEQ